MVFVSNPFEPVTLFQQQKRVTRKCRSLQKFLTAQKWLILGSFRMCPFNLHSNDFPVICPKNKPFLAETLKAETAVAEPPKRVSAMPICHVFLRWVSSLFDLLYLSKAKLR
jgi:hypothetical protein